MDEPELVRMKTILREKSCPFFTDDELQFYVNESDGNVDAAIYRCLILKSMDTTLSVSGLSVADTSKYFRRIAQAYRPNNSRILEG